MFNCLRGVTILLVLAIAGESTACICQNEDHQSRFDFATDVFRGTVIAIENIPEVAPHMIIATFDSPAYWKGLGERRPIVFCDQTHSCRYQFELGKEYVVFASDGFEPERHLSATDCMGNQEYQLADDVLQFLGEPLLTVPVEALGLSALKARF